MKSKILFLAPILLGLIGCNKQESFSILCPTGAPSLAFYNYANYDYFETTGNPETAIKPAFQTGQYDVIVSPTQGGLNQIVNQGAQYKIAATITFGNFYILSSDPVNHKTLNQGDNILVFSQNDVPGVIFRYCYEDIGLNVTYVSSVDLTKQAINSGFEYDRIKYNFIYTAEPVVTATNSKEKVVNNVSEDFFNKSGSRVTQASIFVRNNANKTNVDNLLNKIEENIETAISTPSIVKDALDAYGSTTKQQAKFGLNSTLAFKVLSYNGVSLGFTRSINEKDDLETYMHIFPQFKDMELDEEVFYK